MKKYYDSPSLLVRRLDLNGPIAFDKEYYSYANSKTGFDDGTIDLEDQE